MSNESSADQQSSSPKIMPFVVQGEAMLIKDSIRGLLDYLCRKRASGVDLNPEQEMVRFNERTAKQIAEFFQLMLTYLSISVRISSHNLQLINVRKFVEMFPDVLVVVCEFNSNFFPADWFHQLDDVNRY